MRAGRPLRGSLARLFVGRHGMRAEKIVRAVPARLWIGLALTLAAWALSFGLDGLRTHALFFPQWLGAILCVDGWNERRFCTSLLRRSPRTFALSFAASIPLWWLFEAANVRLGNWIYLGREHFTAVEFALWSSLSFSTVVPAILVICEACAGGPGRGRRAPRPLAPEEAAWGRRWGVVWLVLGVLQVAAWLLWPRQCFPMVWTSGVFLLEAACAFVGRRGLFSDLARGDTSRWRAAWIGGLVCGFLWEAWNFRAYPKWIYRVPGVDFWRVFEMPALGYLGYLPFAHAVLVYAVLVLERPGSGVLGPLGDAGARIDPRRTIPVGN